MNSPRPESTSELHRQDGFFLGRFTAMASPCEVLIETTDHELAAAALDLAAVEALRVEQKFSRYRTDNLIHRINTAAGAAIEVDDETGRLIDFADQVFGLSNGLFDITSGVLRRAWRFDGSDNIPPRKVVKGLLPLVGWQKVDWQAPRLRLPEGMEIDLGGIGKEYAVDCALDKLIRLMPGEVPVLLNFGGDLRANRPPASKPAWQVGVEAARAGGPVSQTISLKRGALTTSGDARRFLLRNGVRYSHVLNPRTGWPVKSAPRSVTVYGATCVETGVLSTLAMLKGKDAESFLDAQDVQYWVQRES